jgi:hypothetical protein
MVYFLSHSIKIVPRTVLLGYDLYIFGMQKGNIFTTNKKLKFAFFAHTLTVETGWQKLLKWSDKTFFSPKILFGYCKKADFYVCFKFFEVPYDTEV